MIAISNVEIHGFEPAIRGARNSWDSWDKSDSKTENGVFDMGNADHELLLKLAKAGGSHSKCLRYITVYFDINAPMYWWKEFDTYKVGTVRNSCSTMHRVMSKPFTMDDFSTEHMDVSEKYGPIEFPGVSGTFHLSQSLYMEKVIHDLNTMRDRYLMFKNADPNSFRDKNREEDIMRELWYSVIQLLPSSYNQKSTILLNYQVLRTIYPDRRIHKLQEWRDFCAWIETLPYSDLITAKK
jgi:hypothetical protein